MHKSESKQQSPDEQGHSGGAATHTLNLHTILKTATHAFLNMLSLYITAYKHTYSIKSVILRPPDTEIQH